MKYIDDIRDWLIANNLVTGYKVQPYEFRSPFARLLITGQKAEAHQVANGVVDRANGIIKAMQESYSQGLNFLMVPVSDISITARTEDGRPYCQINLRILANKEG